MTALEWIKHLQNEGILTVGVKNDVSYLHLQTPCKVVVSGKVTKELKDSYESKKEKGGVFVAIPKRVNGVTVLNIDKIIFLTNISETPQNSYSPDKAELHQALKDTYSGQLENSLPLRFHTHPTHSENPMNEMFNYIFQCNTSQQDQLVSDFPVSVGDLNILMPRSLVLCNGKIADRMFIGFYNGLIAPIEFETHRKEQLEKAMDTIFSSISEWAKEGNNKILLAGGGLILAILIIRYNKFAIPLILMIAAMVPMFINDQHGQPQYFAQVSNGGVTIDFPSLSSE